MADRLKTVFMLHIAIRKTLDWADEAAFDAQLVPEFRPTVEVWNQTFSMPYHLFRHRVRQISHANHAEVQGGTILEWDAIPPGSLVLPVDDDDWFAPNIAHILAPIREQNPGCLGFRWESAFLEIPIDIGHRLYLWKRRLFRTAPRWYCTTNNYAVVKERETADAFSSHICASEWFLSNRERVRNVPGTHSLMNRTLASRTSLGLMRPESTKPIRPHRLVRKYQRYRAIYTEPVARELEWAEPYVRSMRLLMGELLLG